MLPDLAGLIGGLRTADVSFVAIGGIAVAAHQVVRATEDLDLVPDPAHENLDALADVLLQLDARLLRNPDRGIDAGIRARDHLIAMKRARGSALDRADLERLLDADH